MIRFIAAIDSLRGIADDRGIPWDLPSDKKYYRQKVSTGNIIMGYGTYINHRQPLHSSPNYVATSHTEPLRRGFERITDTDTFFKKKASQSVWVLGGAGLYESAYQYADELHITQVCGDFNCTKFFPPFENDFTLISKNKIMTENGIDFQYQVWQANRLLASSNSSEDV